MAALEASVKAAKAAREASPPKPVSVPRRRPPRRKAAKAERRGVDRPRRPSDGRRARRRPSRPASARPPDLGAVGQRLIPMPLEEYRRKRDFARTPEPAPAADPGGRAPADRAAAGTSSSATGRPGSTTTSGSRSTASSSPGPCPRPDPGPRPAADGRPRRGPPDRVLRLRGRHPRPKQYGAGDVIVWDWGTWEAEAPTLDARPRSPTASSSSGLRRREAQGPVHDRPDERSAPARRRSGARAFEDDAGEQWLLIHKRDEHAVAGWDAEDHPQSVKTGRTNDEVKAARDALWNGQAPAPAAGDRPDRRRRRRRCPSNIEPMLATLASKPFSDPDWLFEIKWDGFRVQAVAGRPGGPPVDPQPQGRRRPTSRACSRRPPGSRPARPSSTARSWRSTRPAVPTSACSRSGSATPRRAGLVFQAFDLLYLDGRSLLNVPLEDRKRLLQSVLRPHPRVRFAAHVVGEGVAFYEAAEAQGLEGIIAKLRRRATSRAVGRRPG